jgi:hypothetical protein
MTTYAAKTTRWLSAVAVAITIAGCGGAGGGADAVDAAPEADRLGAQNAGAPSSGRLLAIGQDFDSIANYVNGMGAGQTPGAVVGYIDMDLNGLTNTVDNGAGRNNISSLARVYPKSALVVAVYAVDKLNGINSGQYDAKITTLVNTLKSYNRPVYLRFGYEFDGPWNHYDPAGYKAAFIRIKNRIDALGAARNISMVWQSSSYCENNQVTTYQNRPLNDWYPGDAYVGLVALSYFTPTASASAKGGTCGVTNEAINRVADYANAHGKPLMIAESTPQGYSTGARTWHNVITSNNSFAGAVTDAQLLTWYNDYFAWINQRNVRIVTYINANWQAQSMWASGTSGYWGDSRVEANAAVKNNWISKTSGFLKASSANLFATLGF